MSIHTPASQTLAIRFTNGFTHYADLAALVGEHRAQVALQRCIDACHVFKPEVLLKAEKISNSPYINPDQISGVDVVVTAMCVEVLKSMHEGHCFETDPCSQPWEFVTVSAGKLFIRPPNLQVELQHPLLGSTATGLLA